MAARPLVTVLGEDGAPSSKQLELPAVFTAPIRPDVVHFVHSCMAKNKRQAYAVNVNAGKQHSAESWGTGRAVSRIPRVQGGGTHAAGAGAFGNMCRGGRMFSPNKTFRKWHSKINQNQRRYAVASALAASAVPALVMARGHRIEEVEEVPLVVSDKAEQLKATKKAVDMLAKIKADADVKKCADSKKLRAGKGKMRNRRYTMRRGPLIVYKSGGKEAIELAFRNIPGVELCCVDRLNLLQLAPGGHLGRFCVWTESAFASLDELFGTHSKQSELKKGFKLSHPMMNNADLGRLINSDEVQSTVRPAKETVKRSPLKKNPLKNFAAMQAINPAAATAKRRALLKQKNAIAKKEEILKAKRAGTYEIPAKDKAARKEIKKSGKAWFKAAVKGTDLI
mmetsp:Transcript_18359/g.49381  ORF Transcript_18359/g.49381 Transcript_18359/m.49381 type:complete len:395 (+) Transcript_18359:44-1228(+)